MNVIIANNYKDALANLDIDVIKRLDGEFDVDTIIETFSNFYFNRMILDITALRDSFNISTIQRLCSALDASKIILFLSDDPRINNQFLSRIISLGIYNFTRDLSGITYLMNNPNSYRDVAQYHDLADKDMSELSSGGSKTTAYTGGAAGATAFVPTETFGADNQFNNASYSSPTRIIGFKNLTPGAGSTSLIYMLKKNLKGRKVLAVELNKNDFALFNDGDMMSVGANQLNSVKSRFSQFEIVLIDINNTNVDVDGTCSDVIYLLEPSMIKLNALLRRDRQALEKIKNGKIVLSKSLLSQSDVSEFEYEAKVKMFYNIPPLDERKDHQEVLQEFLQKLGISGDGFSDGETGGLFNSIFKR